MTMTPTASTSTPNAAPSITGRRTSLALSTSPFLFFRCYFRVLFLLFLSLRLDTVGQQIRLGGPEPFPLFLGHLRERDAQIVDRPGDDAGHERTRHVFVVGGDHPPWRPLGAGVLDHVLERVLILVPVLPLVEIAEREFPKLLRVLQPFHEALALLLLG